MEVEGQLGSRDYSAGGSKNAADTAAARSLPQQPSDEDSKTNNLSKEEEREMDDGEDEKDDGRIVISSDTSGDCPFKILKVEFASPELIFKIPKGIDLHNKTQVKRFEVRWSTLYIELVGREKVLEVESEGWFSASDKRISPMEDCYEIHDGLRFLTEDEWSSCEEDEEA